MGRAVIAHSITNSVGRRFSRAHAALMRPDSRADAHTSTVHFPPGLEYSSLLAFHLEQATVAPLSRLKQTPTYTQRVRRKRARGVGVEEAQTSAAGGQQFRVSALSTWTCRFFFWWWWWWGIMHTHIYVYTHVWKEDYSLSTHGRGRKRTGNSLLRMRMYLYSCVPFMMRFNGRKEGKQLSSEKRTPRCTGRERKRGRERERL